MSDAVDPPIDIPQSFVVAIKGGPVPTDITQRIELDLSKFSSGRWALQLDSVFTRRDAPVVILAHGVACLAVAWWAQLSPRSYLRSVAGALFHSPLHVGLDQLAVAATVRAGPTYQLPFSSVIVSDLAYRAEDLLALADTWGSGLVALHAPHKSNSTNRHGPLSMTEAMLLEQLPALERGTPVPQVQLTVARSPARQGASD